MSAASSALALKVNYRDPGGTMTNRNKHVHRKLSIQNLSTDQPHLELRRISTARVSLKLSGAGVRGLRQWAREQGLSPLVAMVTGWTVVLRRRTRQDDMICRVRITNHEWHETNLFTCVSERAPQPLQVPLDEDRTIEWLAKNITAALVETCVPPDSALGQGLV